MNTEPVKLNQKDRAKLRKIRKMVEATHWIKKDYLKDGDKPQYCLVGFVNHVTGARESAGSHLTRELPEQRNKLLRALEWAIKQHRPRTTARYIENFNDSNLTKREDIIAVLDLAIGDDK